MQRSLRFAIIACFLLLAVCTAYAVQFTESDGEDIPQIVPVEAYIRDWMALGPFPQDPAGEDTNYIPACWKSDVVEVFKLKSTDGELSGSKWQKVSAANGKTNIDFNVLYGQKNDQVAYAATYIFAEKDCRRELLLGSDDSIIVWLNGEKVHENYIRRGCQPDSDKANVELRKGRNLMVVKVTQAILGWEFVARFNDNKGLTVSTSPDQSTAVKLLGSDDTDVAPKLVINPYVQNMTKDGVTIMWQSDIPAIATLSVSDGKEDSTYKTLRAVRLGEVRVDDLKPDTRYTYNLVLSSARGATSGQLTADNWTFKTFPTKFRPTRFIVYGDNRTHPERHAQVINAMAEESNVDFVLHVGDLVGAGHELKLWTSEFFTPAGKMMSSVPFFPCLGNHEGNTPYYYQYFSLPMKERWYSFDLPDIHIIVLDSCTDFGPGSEQYKWLIYDLANSRHIKWKFVMLHHPPYTSGNHGSVDESGNLKEVGIRTGRRIFPQLAKQYGITAVFTGHDHNYERSTQDDVHYVVAGGGGAPSYSNPNAKHNPYSKSFYSGLSYLVVDVNDNGVDMTAKTPDGKVIDKFESK